MKVSRWFAVALLGLALSVFFLVHNIGSGLNAMSVHNGNGVTNVSTGWTYAGFLLKAIIVMGSLLASTRKNAMYYGLGPLSRQTRLRRQLVEYHGLWLRRLSDTKPAKALRLQQREYLPQPRRPLGDFCGCLGASCKLAIFWALAGGVRRKRSGHAVDLLLRRYTSSEAYLEQPNLVMAALYHRSCVKQAYNTLYIKLRADEACCGVVRPSPVLG